jgi:hypothetical protein
MSGGTRGGRGWLSAAVVGSCLGCEAAAGAARDGGKFCGAGRRVAGNWTTIRAHKTVMQGTDRLEDSAPKVQPQSTVASMPSNYNFQLRYHYSYRNSVFKRKHLKTP